MAVQTIKVNRAPVLTLWAAVVAEHLGYEWDTALTLGKALAGLNAQSKGRSLGIYKSPDAGSAGKPKAKSGLGEDRWVELCGRLIPVKSTPAGLRAVVLADPIDPAAVARYLEGKFGEALPDVRKAMQALARAHTQKELEAKAFDLYQAFRPQVARGEKGWGQAGDLDLARIRSLAKHGKT